MAKQQQKPAAKTTNKKQPAKKTQQKKQQPLKDKKGKAVNFQKKQKQKEKPMNIPKKPEPILEEQPASDSEPEHEEPVVQQKIKPQNKSIKKNKEKQEKAQKSGKAARFEATQSFKTNPEDLKKIIYVGHLPHGLLEDQLKQYFVQYGNITGVKVGRSRKTARSKGFGFVQFELPEVAEIAAKAMNGYMILGRILEVHILDKEQPNPFLYKSGKTQYKFINWSKKFAQEYNQDKSQEQLQKQVEGLLENEDKKRQQLKELGIEYDFPGYKSLLPQQQQEQPKKQNQKTVTKTVTKTATKTAAKTATKPAAKTTTKTTTTKKAANKKK